MTTDKHKWVWTFFKPEDGAVFGQREHDDMAHGDALSVFRRREYQNILVECNQNGVVIDAHGRLIATFTRVED
jgi:hypothetical protein